MTQQKGGCILIEGEAGIGKSRLLEEIRISRWGGYRGSLTMLYSSADPAQRSQAMSHIISSPKAHLRSNFLLHQSRCWGRVVLIYLRRSPPTQVMYPWRSMFRAMFRQDREQGGLYCLRAKSGADGRPLVVTQLGARLAASGADWASWAKSLAALLELQEDEMPTLPLWSAEEELQHRAPSLASAAA